LDLIAFQQGLPLVRSESLAVDTRAVRAADVGQVGSDGIGGQFGMTPGDIVVAGQDESVAGTASG